MSYLIGDVLVPGDIYGGYLSGRSNLEEMRQSLIKLMEYTITKVIESHTDALKIMDR